MASAVTKATIFRNTWQNFYDIVKDDVFGNSVTDAHSNTHSITRVTNSFPDTEVDNKSTYPLLVVESPRLGSDEQFTLDKEESTGEITISIYTTNAEAADKFLDLIINAIEQERDTLADNELTMVKKVDTDSDSVQRSQIKVHIRSVTYTFKFRYTRTRSF